MLSASHTCELLKKTGCKTEKDVSLSAYSSFKIGGIADFMLFPQTADEIKKILLLLKEYDMKHLILGKGSNILFPDEGIRDIIISTENLDYLENKGDGILTAGSGIGLSRLCNFAYENSLGGLEFAYGIPGSVGGAVYMNAGAYGGEMSRVLLSAKHINAEGELCETSVTDMSLGYRRSCYTDSGSVIVEASVKLDEADSTDIKSNMQDITARRRAKQPLEFPSAGSVFKRPEGYYAGALIEQCGLKGKSIGGAEVSEKHAGFIINKGGATASDVRKLIEFIQNTVLKECGVMLETEIKIIEN